MTITNEPDMSIQNHNGQANNLGVAMAMGAKQEVNPRDAYSVPGILHFIQHEWAKFELERSKWDVERAELEAKIAFLQGERKGQENLKNDLVRRIKMLEHALKQERARFHKLKYGTDLSQGDLKDAELDEAQEDAGEADQLIIASSDISWRQGRQLLRQYLHEIGYTDTVIDVRSNRVRSLLGLKENKDGVPAQSIDPVASKSDVQAKVASQNQAGLLAEDMLREAEQAVLANCHFLNPDGGVPVDDGDEDEEDWKSEEINTGKQGKSLGDDERDSSNMAMALKSLDFNFGNMSMVNPWDENSAMRLAASKDPSLQKPGMRMNSAHYGMEVNDESLEEMGLGELAQLTVTNEAEGMYESGTSKEAYSKMWNAKYTLRSHFDGVRALAFHPIEPALITASEDHTLKLWNLMRTIAGKKSAFLDVEPVYTFRGHQGAVLATCMNPTGEQCYSGGVDGTVRVWNVPNSNIDPYDAYDPDVLSLTLSGHTDAVWGLAFHTQKPQLLSCSADGTVKLWSPGSKAPLLQSYAAEPAMGVPSSVDFVHEDCSHMVAAYTSGRCAVYDLETSKVVMQLESNQNVEGGAPRDQVNCVVSHPTMPVTVAAHGDRHIRFYDNVTGKVVQAMVAHQDAVTSLAVDPHGLYLLSGSHDCSVRLWNLETKQCVQEITAHRKKSDESIHCVGFHPTKPYIASGGADALAKVFV
ncbi:striatin-4-like [Amphibalanus amphitrite]|uniref:striatin-4-like n=1 Tax=Amphibalanus amphitrite TaxID=1232801 RepID=UPI001C901DDB|nr:striatin-4-like [Amphibalanus amphitrite]